MKNVEDKIGRLGEDAVCQYLIAHNHTIVARNWRTGHLEIDLISIDRNGIHFVEVKSRTAPVMAPPEENVGRVKQRRIARAAARYLSEHGPQLSGEMEAHLDVASVIFHGSEIQVTYFEDAYFPTFL